MNDVIITNVETVKWIKKPWKININGYAYINCINMDTNEKVKKSLRISNGEKTFVLSVANTYRNDITEQYGDEIYNYDYAGFKCTIDVGFIDNMHPLDEGEWKIELYINADGEERYTSLKTLEVYEQIPTKKITYMKGATIHEIEPFIDEESNLCITSRVENVSKVRLKLNRMKSKMKSRIKGSKFAKWVRKKIKKNKVNSIKILYKVLCILPVKENKVAFLTDSRGGLYGNFRMVYEELEKRGGYDIKYICKPHDNMKKNLVEKIKIVNYMATSKAVFLDDYYPFIYNLVPREGVNLVQLWHAPGAFKTFGFSREGKLGWTKNKRARNHRAYTHAIVTSKNIRKHYAEAYGISEDKVVATGVPRTDVFFDEKYKNEKIEELYTRYPKLKDKKVILFAPTFRGKGRGGYYNFNLLELDKLMEAFLDEYIFVIKLHPFISNIPEWDEKYNDFIIDLTHEKEINDLLFITDILITDYSSVTFEFALLERPIIFFAYDIEDYIAKRDFYYPYESFVPGPIVKNTDEIIEKINNNDFHIEKLNKFRDKFFDHFDGKSTERVVDLILKNK